MNLNIVEAATSTLRFASLTIPIIAVASFSTSLLLKRGLMEKFATAFKPILKKLNLNGVTITSVAVCFVSATASYSMLSQALKEGIIDDREVIAASFINSLPATITHIYYFFIPFVIPVLGWVGVIYTTLRISVAATKSIFGLILAKMWSKEGINAVKSFYTKNTTFSPLSMLKRVVPTIIVTYFLVQLAVQLKVFDMIGKVLFFFPFDSKIVSIAAAELVDMKAAVVMCKALLEKDLTVKWAVAALMLGNVVTFSTAYVKHSLPLHLSLFGKLGIKIVLLNGLASLILDILLILGVILFL